MYQDALMAEVDKRTSLAYSNEFEMLTFRLTDGQTYGLNVFKIIEILETPKHITRIPHSHPTIRGEINFRGNVITLIDLAQFLGLPRLDLSGISYVLVCEYSKTVQGFLVSQPDILITKNWDEIIKPKGALYDASFLTAITYQGDLPIQILDVEKILNDIIGIEHEISPELLARGKQVVRREHHVLAVDDSRAACHLIELTMEKLGLAHTVVDTAPKALQLLESSLGADGRSCYTIVFTDIEMPVMDGFTFIRKVRENPRLKNVWLAVHSSLSNKTNQTKAQQMGANAFLPKFTADNIVTLILDQLEQVNRHAHA